MLRSGLPAAALTVLICALAAPLAPGTAGRSLDTNCAITEDRSIEGTTGTTIEFVNATVISVGLYWLDYQGARVLYHRLVLGETYVQQTFLTHPWVAVDDAGNCVGYVISDAPTKRYVITVPVAAPVEGVSVNAQPVTGTVLVRVRGSTSFVPLQAVNQVPVGSELDVTKGTVRLQAASGAKGRVEAGTFAKGRFLVRQKKAAGPATAQLVLRGGDFTVCGRSTSARAAPPKKTVRRLFSKVKGHFQTIGGYSSATVRGTQWLVEDRCDGTRTFVTSGRVVVVDFARKRTVTLTAGKSYLAAKP
jgi:hypothetical protein